jgi:hypothetical protein
MINAHSVIIEGVSQAKYGFAEMLQHYSHWLMMGYHVSSFGSSQLTTRMALVLALPQKKRTIRLK